MSMFLSRTLDRQSDRNDIYAERRIRRGKTARDRLNGNASRNAGRKAARAEWQKDNRATNATFPA